MNMTYKIIVASQKEKLEQTLLYKSLVSHCITTDKVIFFGNNKHSLAEIYNEGIDICNATDIKLAIFVHDDVYINCGDFERRIRHYAELFDVYGLAGNSAVTIKEPVLWHLMSERENLRGCVAHGLDETNYAYTSFGPLPSKVVMFDGVFMGVNLEKLPGNVRFDEKNPAKFHFYDLMFSLDCSLSRLKVGVGDVPIVHNSPGLRNVTDEWKSGQKYFLEKYSKYSNKTLTV